MNTAILLGHKLAAYVARNAVATIYGDALATAFAVGYLRLQGVGAEEVAPGLQVTRCDGTVAVVKPVFTNDGGGSWLYVVDALDAAAEGE